MPGSSSPALLSHKYSATGAAATTTTPSSSRISQGEVSQERGKGGSA
jgi:hypothetical protein